MPEFIDPVFAETSPKRSFSMKRELWACFRKNWVYRFGHRTVATFALKFVMTGSAKQSQNSNDSLQMLDNLFIYLFHKYNIYSYKNKIL